MRREELLGLVTRLGREFSRREMKEHVRVLRLYYLALSHGLVRGGASIDVHWNEAQTTTWLEALRVPPFEHALERRPLNSPCPICSTKKLAPGELAPHPASVRALQFPGGARKDCVQCGSRWLELEDAELPSAISKALRP